MLGRLKMGLRSAFDRLGYEIRPKPSGPPDQGISHLESCLHLLMGVSESINIVQVGANDGAINDPLYNLIARYPRRTRVILVEPQSQLIPYLKENYRFHDAKYIFNGAVGPDPELTLYRIREDFWSDLVVPYAKDWPEYRAPTGVTSADYDHVARWLSHTYRGRLSIAELIETERVAAIDINTLLKRANLFGRLDALQVDAEGFDDQVIYACNIEELRPLIINFEFNNLDDTKAGALERYLTDLGYVVSPHGIDGLAVRTMPFKQEDG